MDRQDAVSELFIHIENDDEKQAKQVSKRVRGELLILKQICNKSGANLFTIQEIEKLLENVEIGKINIARGKCVKVKDAFNKQQLSNYLKSNTDAPNDSSPVQHQQRQTKALGSKAEDGRMRQVNSEDVNHRRTQQSKRASYAMVQNNPDIADLSDTNRPTKIAERFSEMYDNEWTECFEDLGKCKKGKLEEAESISLLLDIVQEAYKMCLEESQSQIREMEKVIKELLTGQKSIQTDREHASEGRTLLIQYRKDIAELALERLQKNFRGKLNDVCRKRLTLELLNADSTVKYAQKAVELCWWMSVQDPPVFMCSTAKETFDPNLYKAYTKSGSVPEYFVWPALRLHKDGAVLLKGVVQFK